MRYHPKTQPFKHQARATLAAARARNHAIFMEPRLGKSKAALDTVGILALKGEVKRVLIIAPRIAIDEVWPGQIEKHFPYPYYAETFDEEWHHQDMIYAGSPPEVKFFLAGREETFRRTRTKKGKYLRPKQNELEAWRPDYIIIDESHEYKRPGGVGAQDCWHLVQRLRRDRKDGMPYVLLLSGTPNPKGYIDLFAQYRIMDDRIFGTAVEPFKDKHVLYGHGKRRWTVLKYLNTTTLERKIRDHSITVSAEEAGLAGKQFHQLLRVRLPEHAAKLYLELVEEFMAEWEGGIISAKNAGVRRLRLLQITGGFLTDGTVVHRTKLEKLRAYSSLLLEQGESVVVYSRFTAEVEATTEALQSMGFRTYRVDGTVSRKDRSAAIAALSRRPSVPTAISFQYQAGSMAIELVGAAEAIYYSVPEGWVAYRQTSARLQGPNQKRPVRYSFIVCPGTVDMSALAGLKQKESWHNALMRNPRAYLLPL